MKRTRTHLHVVGLQQNAALLTPELLQAQDHVLKRCPGPQGRRAVGARFSHRLYGIPVHAGAHGDIGVSGAHYTQTAQRVTWIVMTVGLAPCRRAQISPASAPLGGSVDAALWVILEA